MPLSPEFFPCHCPWNGSHAIVPGTVLMQFSLEQFHTLIAWYRWYIAHCLSTFIISVCVLLFMHMCVCVCVCMHVSACLCFTPLFSLPVRFLWLHPTREHKTSDTDLAKRDRTQSYASYCLRVNFSCTGTRSLTEPKVKLHWNETPTPHLNSTVLLDISERKSRHT